MLEFITSPLGIALIGVAGVILGAIISPLLGHILTHGEKRKVGTKQTINNLQQNIKELEDKLAVYEDVERSPNGDCYIVKATGETICPVCWGAEHSPIPVRDDGTGHYKCSRCGDKGVFSSQAVAEYDAKQEALFQTLNNINARHRQNQSWF